MNANEWAEMTKLTSEIMKLIEKNRGQKEEIEFLKKEILAKHEDWKHEGQQAANARAEIEALKLCCPKCGGVTGKLEVLNVPAKTCQHGVDDGACKECYAEAQEK